MRDDAVVLSIGKEKKEYPLGTTLKEIAAEYESPGKPRIVLAVCDGKLTELYKEAPGDAHVRFLTEADPAGSRAYRRSACLILYKALADLGESLFGKKTEIFLRFSVPDGFYFTAEDGTVIDETVLDSLKARMDDLIREQHPIVKHNLYIDDALAIFRKQGMSDKERLFRYRRVSRVNVYTLEGYSDYFYGFMVPDTGYINRFALRMREDGFVLALPSYQDPAKIPQVPIQNKVFQVQRKTENWGDRIGVSTVGELNDRISREGVRSLMMMHEAIQEAAIAGIASSIVNRENTRFVMIAGPSSSGKTSFSYRLSVQLSAMGMNPHPIALDNYFLNREDTPLDEYGERDYECLGALDIEGFNADMLSLLSGKEVVMPTFNFLTGKREYKGERLRMKKDDILVLEGIHGLNDNLSFALPGESKYKVYVSPFTQLNIDQHNSIEATDGRLLRRIVRDARTRGNNASDTIVRWDSVRRGEEKNIFPYEHEADSMFNSALIYELGVLKVYAEPLLFSIEKEDPAYLEAHRLLKFLDYFLPVPGGEVPNNSILREFIGGSCFVQ